MPSNAAMNCAYIKGHKVSEETITGTTERVDQIKSMSVTAITGNVLITATKGFIKARTRTLEAESAARAAAIVQETSHAPRLRKRVQPNAVQKLKAPSPKRREKSSETVSPTEGMTYGLSTHTEAMNHASHIAATADSEIMKFVNLREIFFTW